MNDDIKTDVIAALREQAQESWGHIGEPGYSGFDLERDSAAFANVADWLDDHWTEIVGMH